MIHNKVTGLGDIAFQTIMFGHKIDELRAWPVDLEFLRVNSLIPEHKLIDFLPLPLPLLRFMHIKIQNT